jgi:hypothetical protein
MYILANTPNNVTITIISNITNRDFSVSRSKICYASKLIWLICTLALLGYFSSLRINIFLGYSWNIATVLSTLLPAQVELSTLSGSCHGDNSSDRNVL